MIIPARGLAECLEGRRQVSFCGILDDIPDLLPFFLVVLLIKDFLVMRV
jgi:hypothetical protein